MKEFGIDGFRDSFSYAHFSGSNSGIASTGFIWFAECNTQKVYPHLFLNNVDFETLNISGLACAVAGIG